MTSTEDRVATTVMDGRPAWGSGHFKSGTAYLLWLICLIGFCGLHRMYLGHWISGVIWLLTFGLFGIGQIVDLFLIPSMVHENNSFIRYKYPATVPGQPIHAESVASAPYGSQPQIYQDQHQVVYTQQHPQPQVVYSQQQYYYPSQSTVQHQPSYNPERMSTTM